MSKGSMNKEDLIQSFRAHSGCTKTEATDVIDWFLSTITEQLASGNSIGVTGFGIFSTKIRKARKGRNPKTGEEIDIPEVKVPHFKPGKTLKDAVNA